MLRAVHGNRVEDLLSALLETLPPADPFAPATIVVGSDLVARWLRREIALARGIASGLELVTFDRFVEAAWAHDPPGRAAGLAGLDRHRLGAALASVLADEVVVRSLPPIAAYLAAAPAPGDRAGPRRVQLAEHLAELAWNYALTRPDWMPALVAGRVPNELAADLTARWQAALIGAALARLGDDRRWVPVPMLPWLRRRVGLAPPRLPAPVAVFGMSFLARAQLEALTDLATTTDVTIYVLDPCQELWDDVGGRKAADAAIDPLPLVLWGRPVRDTLASLVERTGGDLDGRFRDEPAATACARLLADVRARRAAVLEDVRDPAGVVVLACPNPRREIEVIATEVRHRLDADPTLRGHEIGVWIAGDAEHYLAQASSAFEAVGVPCHLIDAPIDDRGRIGEAVLALLELPTSTLARRDLLRVMTHPAVLAGHPHGDPDDWVEWTERLGIAHGADASSHENTYLEDYPGQFHWDQGVRRLALGAFMVGERADRGVARIAGEPVAPEELRPDQQASAATYALLVRSLCADAAWLGETIASLGRWAEIFAGLVDVYLAPRDDESSRDLERVRSILAGLAQLDVDGRPVGFREAREHAARLLGVARSNRGEPLAAGVMIAPLAAMRAVPFRIVFVAGLEEGAFPAGERPSPLDLRREARPGDVSPRDRDRAAFLDVLLSARDALYLSYVAVEPRSGQALGPSSVVLELADALAPYLGASSSREALASITVHQPLHRFGASGGDHDTAVLPAVARERWGIAVRDALHAHLRAGDHPIPDEDGQLVLLAHASQAALRAELAIEDVPAAPAAAVASRALTIANLRSFLEHPVQAWAQTVLGLDELPDDAVADHSDEPFHLTRADRARVLREVFAAQLRDPGRSIGERYDTAVAALQLRGQFPVGVFAEAARSLDVRLLETWRDAIGPIPVDGATRIGFGRTSSAGAQLLPAIELELSANRTIRLLGQTELLLRGDRFTSIVPLLREYENRSPYHLRGALDHVVLAAVGLANHGHTHRLIDNTGRVCEVQHEPWTRDDARAYLVALVRELLDQPHGYLLPFEALVRALAGGKPSVRFNDPTGGLGYGPIDRPDGLELPDDAAGIATRRLGPLIERMRGDHGFEIGSAGAQKGRKRPPRVARPAALPPPDARLVVVEASAGTGKTFFLEHRVVDLILAGAELGQILLVTFTDKAVAELRLRIRDLLDRLSRAAVSTAGAGEAAWAIDGEARRRLRTAVTAFDHAPIYTIHGFCHRILIEDAFSARRLFDQQQIADEVAFDTAFGALLRERFAYRSPDRELLAAFLETRSASGAPRTVDALRAILLGCVRARAPVRRPLDPEAVRAAFAQLSAAFASEAGRAAVIACDRRNWTEDWLDAVTAAIAWCDGDAAAPRQLAAIDLARDACDKLAARAGKLPPDVVAALRAVATTISLDEAIAAQMLPAILTRIGEDKAEAGQFDYDDMLELVWAALTGPRRHELAQRLRERTPWAMIDEFQDTDPVQWNIFRTVWLHPDARGLTIVGDPKQAIYGFRGADVDTYLAARDEMLRADATRVVLDVNRRSTEPLVAAINQILIGTLGLPLLSGRITYDEPVRASGDVACDDARPPVTVFQLTAGGKASADAQRSALCGAIAGAIEQLRAAPPVWRVRGAVRPFALDQVMALTRSNRESAELAAALRARGLPCALVEPERLLQTREAVELACVLAAVAAPRDRSARMRALRTRFFDVSWPDLMQVVDAPDHHPLIARLFDWAQLAARRHYEALFRRIVEDSRFAERALVLGSGERALTNTWHVIELLLAEVARSRSDLHELVGQLRRWIADDTGHPDERDVQRAETDADAVRVLTIHKAKGLEAPYVFLFGGTSGGPRSVVHTVRDATGRALVVGKVDPATQQLLEAEADAENQRLAYVGLTRAQVRLYLPVYGEGALNKAAMYGPIQRCVAPQLSPRPAPPRPAARALFDVVPVAVGAPEPPPPPGDALAGFAAPPPPPPDELAPLPALRGGLTMLSYTRLAHEPDAAAIAVAPGDALALDPAEFDVDDGELDGAGGDDAAAIGATDLPPGADSGLLLHDLLEVADLAWVRRAPDAAAWLDDPEVAAVVADKARERGIAEHYLPHAAAIAHRALTAPLALIDGSALPPLASAAALAREVEFGFPIPAIPAIPAVGTPHPPRGLVKGFIDALVAWDDDLWVLDYKSDLLLGDDLAALAQERVRERYAVQARLYALAADRLRGRRRLAGLLFAFLRHDLVVPVRVTDDTLAVWRDWLARVGASGAGATVVTGGAEARP